MSGQTSPAQLGTHGGMHSYECLVLIFNIKIRFASERNHCAWTSLNCDMKENNAKRYRAVLKKTQTWAS